jgi:hypothetical protein
MCPDWSVWQSTSHGRLAKLINELEAIKQRDLLLRPAHFVQTEPGAKRSESRLKGHKSRLGP